MDPVENAHGETLKFIGDAMLAIFRSMPEQTLTRRAPALYQRPAGHARPWPK
jgi:class 3 adenylate cyclase